MPYQLFQGNVIVLMQLQRTNFRMEIVNFDNPNLWDFTPAKLCVFVIPIYCISVYCRYPGAEHSARGSGAELCRGIDSRPAPAGRGGEDQRLLDLSHRHPPPRRQRRQCRRRRADSRHAHGRRHICLLSTMCSVVLFNQPVVFYGYRTCFSNLSFIACCAILVLRFARGA